MVIILFVRKQNDEDEEDVAKLGSPAEFWSPWNVDLDGSKK